MGYFPNLESGATPWNSEDCRSSSSDPAAAPEVHLPIICPVFIPRGEIRPFTFLLFLELGGPESEVHRGRGLYRINQNVPMLFLVKAGFRNIFKPPLTPYILRALNFSALPRDWHHAVHRVAAGRPNDDAAEAHGVRTHVRHR